MVHFQKGQILLFTEVHFFDFYLSIYENIKK